MGNGVGTMSKSMLSHDSTPVAEGLVLGLLQRLDVDVETPDLLSDAAHSSRRHVFCYLFWNIRKGKRIHHWLFGQFVFKLFPPSFGLVFEIGCDCCVALAVTIAFNPTKLYLVSFSMHPLKTSRDSSDLRKM